MNATAHAVPEHYRGFYGFFLRFGLTMLVLGGFAGVLHVEVTRGMTYAEIPPGMHLQTTYRLAILHGHAFLVGAVIPFCWLIVLQTALAMGAAPLRRRTLLWVGWTYVPGAISVLGLIAYKGLHYVRRVREDGAGADLDAIHDELFGGHALLRGLVYGTSHTIATIALLIFAVAVWRSLARAKRSAS